MSDGVEILVPARDDLGDYASRMAEAIQILAEREERSALTVYRDLASLPWLQLATEFL